VNVHYDDAGDNMPDTTAGYNHDGRTQAWKSGASAPRRSLRLPEMPHAAIPEPTADDGEHT
jgi:hypothetical protein